MSKRGKKNRKSRGRANIIHFHSQLSEGEYVQCEPLDLLAHRIGIPSDEIRRIAMDESPADFDLIEQFRLWASGIASTARDAKGKLLCRLADGPNAHVLLILHQRGRVEAHFGPAVGEWPSDVAQIAKEVAAGLLPQACLPRQLRERLREASETTSGSSTAENSDETHE